MRHNSTSSTQHERLLILGSGVAGCATALTAARHGVPVTVLHAGSVRDDCNSYWAQGGIIYKNYHLRQDVNKNRGGSNHDGNDKLVDTSLSLVEDIRVASGYLGKLQRNIELEEGLYGGNLILNKYRNNTRDSMGTILGQKCSTTNIHWNEDAAWKLACEGPSRVRELLLGKKDGGMNHDDGDHSNATTPSMGCVVPFDRVTEGVDALSLCLGELVRHILSIIFSSSPLSNE